MQDVIVYCIKMTACSGLLFLYYVLALRNRKINGFNRFFLLASASLSVLLPLVKIPVQWTGDATAANPISQALQAITIYPGLNARASWTSLVPTSWVAWAYLAVSVFLLLQIARSLFSVARMIRKYPARRIDHVSLHETVEPNTPFTFNTHIFWNRELPIDSGMGRQVFRHEWLHASEGHTHDLVLMRIILVFAWINPFLHLIKKELIAVHEFLADEYATSGSDKTHYAKSLIHEAIVQKKTIALAHHFYYSPFKRRIHMLLLPTKQRRFSILRKAMAIPLVAVIACAMTMHAQSQSASPSHEANAAQPGKTATAIATQGDSDAQYPGGGEAWIDLLLNTLKYPEAAEKQKIEGPVMLQFKVDKEGSVSDVEAISGPTEGGLREESVRVLKLSGKWLPAMKDGQPVESVKKQPIVFKLGPPKGEK